ncbi:MAG: 16S rRNA (adenine(1518)-N(6)/adenine(1519)-N(6))-dimethyltransferase RsmA [Candidatus Cloacimonetes bacterium]|nr:16S rRNA (adenine(1518)-N(6)/adenine(1519)-N(6))-dimethyltransferase RsmA [Candidatus Cloacimonadota bacterium]
MHKPKKKFGQHFLNDQSVFERIIENADLQEDDIVWEIGAGLGALTDHLLKHKIDLTIFEIDNDLMPILEKKYSDKCKIVHKDILKVDWKGVNPPHLFQKNEIIKKIDNELKEQKKIKIITNLPYQISSPFLYKISENYHNIERVVIMLQKEVSKRVCAKPFNKDYGVLSLKTQFYFLTEYLFEVSPEKFTPPPAVYSAVIRLLPRKDIPILENEKYFWEIVESSFRMKRKTLKNNLKFELEKKKIPLLFSTDSNLGIPIDLNRRGETLNEADFIALYEYFLQFTRS